MARVGIVYSHVANAAAQLVAAGKNPTVDGVRAALGGTGSKSTIAPLLKRWKAEHQETVVETGPDIPAALLNAMKGVYEQLQADAQQQIERARQEHAAALQVCAEQVEQAQADQRALSAAHAALAAQLEQTRQALTELQAEQHARDIALAALHSDNTGLQQRLADRAAEVAALNAQLAQARRQFEHYQEASAAQRTQERQAGEQRIARLEHDLAGVQQRLQASQSTIAQQEAHLAHMGADRERLQQSAGVLQDALASLRPERDQFAYQCGELTSANRAFAQQLEVAREALIEARMALAAEQRQTELITERLAHADGKSHELEQERLVLIHEKAMLQAQVNDLHAKPGGQAGTAENAVAQNPA